MFYKKKNEKKSGKIIDGADQEVTDFLRRTIYWSYRTKPYQFEKRFAYFLEVINDHLDFMFKGDVDSGNGNMLDNLIHDACRYAIHDLEKQKVEHQDIINSLKLRFLSDWENLQKERQLLCNLLTKYEIELADTESRLNNHIYARSENHETA